MNTFKGIFEGDVTVTFPEEVWEVVSSEGWQSAFCDIETKEDLARILAAYPSETRFCELEMFNIPGGGDIRVIHDDVAIDISEVAA